MVLIAAALFVGTVTSCGVAAALRSASGYAAQRAERKCEASLAAGEQKLAEEQEGGGADAAASAAEKHFSDGLSSLDGFGSSRVALVTHNRLQSRARDGCARACLRLARLEDAVAQARLAVDAARRASDVALCCSASITLCDALLGKAAQWTRLATWDAAQRAAQDALTSANVAADAHRQRLAAEALDAARRGAFEQHMTTASALLQQRRWADAVKQAQLAMGVAPDALWHAHATRLIATARASACDAHLAASAAAVQQRRWRAALADAQKARTFLSSDEDDAARTARVIAALAAARLGAHDAHMATCAQELAAQRWAEALTEGQHALQMADDDAQRGLARTVIARARAGPCNARLAASAAAAAQQDWATAQTEAERARRLAPDAAHIARADAAMLAARIGACDAHLAASATAAQQRRWPAALQEAEAARLLAVGDAARTALAAAALAAARLGTFNAHMASSAQALAAHRWADAATQAELAWENADGAQLKGRANAAIEQAQAAEAAEPDYITAVDACIRAQFKFTGHEPCSFRCAIATIANKCRKPGVIPGALVHFLRQHPEEFTLGMPTARW
jgi:hypothetical protein